MRSLRVIDSHTGGEPTRLVVEGVPEIGGSVAQRLEVLRSEHDVIRRTLCLEPRGSEVAVGAVLFPPSLESCLADVVFFNNTGYLGMCGHGTIGVMASLHWSGRIGEGSYRLNTVAGIVAAHVHDAATVSFDNVPSYRWLQDVEVEVPQWGTVVGDVAYGGNWFFLCEHAQAPVTAHNIPALTALASAIMDTLWDSGVTGADGARIDHVEIFGPPSSPRADSKSFVLCPGKQYDRSPCGTGTSAKLACLYASGKLREGDVWTQESVIGSTFEGSVRVRDGQLCPQIKGKAYVTAECTVVWNTEDPLTFGITL